MKKGIFQGCPIFPYLFLLVIETTALAIRHTVNIKGIPIDDWELKISLFADDSICFLDGSLDSFSHLFATLANLLIVLAVKLILPNPMLFGLAL